MSNQVMKVDIFVFQYQRYPKRFFVLLSQNLGSAKKVMVPLLPKYGNSVKIEQNDHDDEGLLFLNQSSSKLLMLWSVHLPFQFEYIYHLTYAAFT